MELFRWCFTFSELNVSIWNRLKFILIINTVSLSNKNSTLHWRQNSCPGTTLIFFVFSCWAICNVITCSACSLFPVKLVEFLRTLSQEHKNISGGCFCKSTELTCKGNYSESSTDCRVISIAFHHIYCIDQKKDHTYLLAHRQPDTIKKQEC